jgi:hypothetical protein
MNETLKSGRERSIVKGMNVSSTSSFSGLAGMATNMRAGELGMQISMAVMKQALDSQKQQGQALVQMIQSSTPSLNGTGSIVDIRA